MLNKEFEYYLKNQSEFVKKYNGKILVIKDQKIIGVFDSEMDAVAETSKNYELGTFLVQKCSPGEENTSITFHSRYVFA
jgi:hypothetical protein